MAFGYQCLNCGHMQEDHDVNLVDKPVLRKKQWFEKIQKGYKMDILECMETPWPRTYARAVEKAFWDAGPYHGSSYRSPAPEKEVEKYGLELSHSRFSQSSVLIVYDTRTGRNAVVHLE